jgi:anti-anti-sigma factor
MQLAKSRFNKRGPGKAKPVEEKISLGELDNWMASINRPQVVVDCSQVDEIGQAEVRLLITCLERVMKRNGDVRLAGVSLKAMETLACTGAERLFQIYDSRDAAIKSFEPHASLELVGEGRRAEFRDESDGGGALKAPLFQYASMRRRGDANE